MSDRAIFTERERNGQLVRDVVPAPPTYDDLALAILDWARIDVRAPFRLSSDRLTADLREQQSANRLLHELAARLALCTAEETP